MAFLMSALFAGALSRDARRGKLMDRTPGRKHRFSKGCFPFLLLLLTVHGEGARAQGQIRLSEYELKAAFFFNFAKFVDWPAEAFADSSTPITIGIIGRTLSGPPLTRLSATRASRAGGSASHDTRGFKT